MITKLFLIVLISISFTTVAFAQDNSTDTTVDIPFEFTAAEAGIVLLGVLGGLTTAYNGYRRNKIKLADSFKWDTGKFLDRVIMGVLVSVPLAIGAAADIVVLNIFTIVMIYLASLGGSQLIMELRARNATK